MKRIVLQNESSHANLRKRATPAWFHFLFSERVQSQNFRYLIESSFLLMVSFLNAEK